MSFMYFQIQISSM